MKFATIATVVRSGGRAVERRTVNRGDSGSISPTLFRNIRSFIHPHICLCLSEETKMRWSLPSGVYARGNKRPHTGGKSVTCSGLTNSREGQLLHYPKFRGNHLLRPPNECIVQESVTHRSVLPRQPVYMTGVHCTLL